MLKMLKPMNKTAEAWSQWLAELDEKRQTLSTISSQIGQAYSRYERARNAAWHHTDRAAALTGIDIGHQPEKEARDQVRSRLVSKIQRAKASKARPPEEGEWKQTAHRLEQAETDFSEAAAHIEELEAQKAQVSAELKDVEQRQPKGSKAALDALDSEIEKLEAEKSRVGQALTEMSEDDGAARKADQEAREAQETLDDIEASTALGEADEAAQRTAATALAKARRKAEQATEEADRQSSRRRGLERRKASLEEQGSSLRDIRNGVAQRVYWVELEDWEKRLVSILEGAELKATLAEINRIRSLLDESTPDGSYLRASLSIKTPQLYAHPERDRVGWSELEI